ncbi:MAG TPA: ABC transporter permease, partial [Anaerolineae bacterium]|nr:ABC transporter permease [Anaerolineae bacterium]
GRAARGVLRSERGASSNRVVVYLGENPLVIVAIVFLLIVVVAAVSAPWVAPRDPAKMVPVDRLRPPGTREYLLGTDSFGRDLLSRVIWGGRISLLAGVVPALAATVIGVIIGLVSGYVGGRLDSLLMGLVDVVLAFPFMLLAIALVAALGPSLENAMLAVIISTAPARVRLIRGVTLSLSTMPFVDAARALGYGPLRILFVEIMPNVLALAVTMFSIDITIMITATAGLSFLGLGVQPPQADWGTMIADGKQFLSVAPHITIIPSLVLTLVCLSFGVIGDAVQDLLNPRALLE